MPEPLNPFTIAHAGNTRQRLALALAAEVDVVEADVWRHGRAMALHHERRLPLLPLLYERWHVRLARGLLNIDDLFHTVDGRAGLLLDLKSGGARAATMLLAALDHHPRAGRVEVSSHHWGTLRRLARARPDVGVYFSIGRERVLQRFERLPLDAVRPAAGVSIQHELLDAQRVERLKLRDLRIYAWTVRDVARARSLLEWGVDGVTCDDLSVLIALQPSRRVA